VPWTAKLLTEEDLMSNFFLSSTGEFGQSLLKSLVAFLLQDLPWLGNCDPLEIIQLLDKWVNVLGTGRNEDIFRPRKS
jgi:hypothetical protein